MVLVVLVLDKLVEMLGSNTSLSTGIKPGIAPGKTYLSVSSYHKFF